MDDLISRQAVIDELHKHFNDGFKGDRWWNSTHVLSAINKVPSAEPQIIHCRDCKHRGTHNCIANLWAAIFKTAVQDDFYCGIGERWDGGGQ